MASDLANPRLAGEALEPLRRPVCDCLLSMLEAVHGTAPGPPHGEFDVETIAEDGTRYHGTSVQDIAAAAGVHVQTIYLAYGTKAELRRSAASWKVSEGEDPAIPPPERRWVRELIAEDDPREKFRLYVRHIRHSTEQWAPMRDVMRAAADEPEVAEKPAAIEYGRYQGPENLWPAIKQKGQLREGLTAEEAAVLTYAIASPDTFRQLLERGWSWNRAEAAITDTLIRTLLRD